MSDRNFLLSLARKTINGIVTYRTVAELPVDEVPSSCQEVRGCFVTLTKLNQLRGCIGNVSPVDPLFRAVMHNAESAARRDPRFAPLEPDELDQIQIEISVLTTPEPLNFKSAENLLAQLQPGIHGVVLEICGRSATFLPQVWELLPEKENFLGQLSQKAGFLPGAWRHGKSTVSVYRVEAFTEANSDPENAA